MRLLVLLVLVSSFYRVGCECQGREVQPAPGADDAGSADDAGHLDGGGDGGSGEPDAGPTSDAGVDDAGVVDGGSVDAGFYTTTITQAAALQISNSTNWTIDSTIDSVVEGLDASVSVHVWMNSSGTGLLPIGSFSSHVQVTQALSDGGQLVVASDFRSRNPVWASFDDRYVLPLVVGHYSFDADYKEVLQFDTVSTDGRVQAVAMRLLADMTDHTSLMQVVQTP